MPGEGRERALLIDRCWSIYILLTEHFSVPSAFHEEFPVLVERATHSGLFHLTVCLSDGHSLSVPSLPSPITCTIPGAVSCRSAEKSATSRHS